MDVSGSKNATLPILAATILNGKVSKLYNVPEISDVKITIQILESLGCKVKKDKKKLIIDSRNMKGTTIPEDLMRKSDYFKIWGSLFFLSRADAILEVGQ